MSHPIYNPRGGLFSSGERTVVTGQYVLGSQSDLDLAGTRLGPDSMSSPRGGMMVNQQMTFPIGQRRPQVSHDLEASIDMNIRGAREEARLLTQMRQQPKTADPRLKKDVRDEMYSSAGSGFAAASVSRRSDDVKWTDYPGPSKTFSSTSTGHSSTSSQRFQPSNFGSSGGQSGLNINTSSEYQSTRYTPESANSILEKFGLSSDDLELLSLYPDDQLTPENLPFILRDIRLRKAKRNAAERDVRPSDRLLSESQQGKVIDYGHLSKFDFPEEKKDTYEHEHHTKESTKFVMETSGSSFSNADKTKRPHQTPAAAARAQPAVVVSKLHQPPVMAPRPSTKSVDIQSTKVILGRQPTVPSVSSLSITRPPQTTPLASGPLTSVVPMVSGNPFAIAASLIAASSAKRFPTPTMMNDYLAANPRIFPHTCSLCNIECAQIKDWIEHQNTKRHIESCRRLRKQYPDWKADTVPVTRAEPKLEHHSPKHHTSSRSFSRTPSPKRHHGSSSRRHHSRSRSRSRSRSPRRYHRRSRSRSRSWSPHRRSRGSPSYRRQSRSPPRQRSRSPGYRTSRHSPVRSSRRLSPRKSSPPRPLRSSSSERLAKKLLESKLSSVSDSSTLKAMVQSLAPALLAELAKKRTTSSSSGKGSGSKRRSPSPSLKRSESLKSSSSSAPKISSSKSVKPRKPAGPGTSCLVRLKHIPFGTTYQEVVDAIEPFGRIHTLILLRQIEEASLCMEKEEDAKALANCKDLMLRGRRIEIRMEKDAKNEPKVSTLQRKLPSKKKEPQPATESQVSIPSQNAKVKEVPKTSKVSKGKPTVKAKPPSKGPEEAQVKMIVKKEIPWRKNIVEITDLPETEITEEELTDLASPYGFIGTPVIAVNQQKAYLEMPNTEAAESLVKAYAETPAKLQEKEISVKMMTKPVDLKYTESVFRVLMGMDTLTPQEKASLPERLLSVSNVPYKTESINEVQNLVKNHGSYKHCLPLNGKIIFEMDSAAIAKSVCSRFIKFPCIIHNNNLVFRLVRVPNLADKMKKKCHAAGPKSVSKPAVKAQGKPKPAGTLRRDTVAPSATTPTSASATGAKAEACLQSGSKKLNETIVIEDSDNDLDSNSLNNSTENETKINDTKITDVIVIDAEESASGGSGMPRVTTEEVSEHAMEFPDANEHGEKVQMDMSGNAETPPKDVPKQAERKSPVLVTQKAETLPVEMTKQTEKSPVAMTQKAETSPMEITEQVEKSPVEITKIAENSCVEMTEQTEKSPLEVTQKAEESLVEMTKNAEKSSVKVIEQVEKSPVEVTEKVKKAPAGVTEKAEKSPAGVTEKAEKSPAGVTEKAGKSPAGVTEKAGKSPAGVTEKAGKSPAGVTEKAGKSPAGVTEKAGKSPAGVTEKAEKSPGGVTENASNSPGGVTYNGVKTPAGVTEKAGKSPAGVTEKAEKTPAGVTEKAGKSPVEVIKHAENAVIEETEQADRVPMEVTEQAEISPVTANEQTENVPMEVTEQAEESPAEETEQAKKSHLEVTEQAEKSPTETTEHVKQLLKDATEQVENSCYVRLDRSQPEDAPKAESLPLVQEDAENSKPPEVSVELLSAEETVEVTGSIKNTTKTSGFGEMETQEAPVEESAHDSQVVQSDLKAEDTENKTEIQIQDELVHQPVQNDAAFQAPEQNQSFEKAKTPPESFPLDNMTMDIPPVTPEILKALEAAVHQCRLQSSLKRAEEQTRSRSEGEKNALEKAMEKVPSSSKKATSSEKRPQADKEIHTDSQLDKGRKPQSSGCRSKRGKPPSPERDSSSRRREKGSPESRPPTTRYGGSSSSCSTGSHKSRADSSVSKRSRERDEYGTKTRSSSRSTRSLRSDTRAKKTEMLKEKDEDPEEPFPFNLDEFVTVDEVTDEAEERTPHKRSKPSSKARVSQEHTTPSTARKKPPMSSSDASSKKGNMPPASGTRRTRTSAKLEAETLEVPDTMEKQPGKSKADSKSKEPEKLEEPPDDGATTPTAFSEVTKKVSMSSGGEDGTKEGTDDGASNLHESSEFDLPALAVEAHPLQASEVQETVPTSELPAKSDTVVHELENAELPPQDALLTLDEVCDEEEHFADDVAVEDLLRQQAEENPETLLTVDEVGDDETEEDQLEKALQGLVTLDEIVAEEDEDEEGSFNPETLVTLDETRDDEQREEPEQDQSKHAKSEAETSTQPDVPVESSFLEEDAHELDELHRMNFVTVDEVGEEEEEKQEQLPQEKVEQEEEAPVTRRGGRARKRVRQAPVRKSTRRKAMKPGNQNDVCGDTATAEEPAADADVSSPNTKAANNKLEHQDVQVEESTEEEKPSVSTQESEVTVRPLNEKRAAIKEESRLRREAEINQEPESKKTCLEPSTTEDFTLPPYRSEVAIGMDFVVPMMGFYCKLCCRFYANERAKISHCRSHVHYQNMEKHYEKLKSQSGSSTLASSTHSSSSE